MRSIDQIAYDLDVRGGVSMQIDGVFSGGGMKGFALVGAIKAAEDKGFIFKRVAGTSAGSIAAVFVAAGFNSQEMYDILVNAPRSSFLDSSFRNFPLIKWLMLYWKMGIYKGNAFEKWLTSVLATKNIHTFKDIERDSLRIIASDISNNRILVIPDDLPRYGINPDDFPVAKAVRMSISIPYIFRPVKINKDVFVDGGLLSNFPIWLYENPEKKPIRPVLGVQLTPKEKLEHNRKIRNSLELFSALFNSALRSHDLRYISRKAEKNIIFIKLKEGVSTDFDMPKDECNEIFNVGEKTANKFFEKWTY
jgi:NTE family protein